MIHFFMKADKEMAELITFRITPMRSSTFIGGDDVEEYDAECSMCWQLEGVMISWPLAFFVQKSRNGWPLAAHSALQLLRSPFCCRPQKARVGTRMPGLRHLTAPTAASSCRAQTEVGAYRQTKRAKAYILPLTLRFYWCIIY